MGGPVDPHRQAPKSPLFPRCVTALIVIDIEREVWHIIYDTSRNRDNQHSETLFRVLSQEDKMTAEIHQLTSLFLRNRSLVRVDKLEELFLIHLREHANSLEEVRFFNDLSEGKAGIHIIKVQPGVDLF